VVVVVVAEVEALVVFKTVVDEAVAVVVMVGVREVVVVVILVVTNEVDMAVTPVVVTVVTVVVTDNKVVVMVVARVADMAVDSNLAMEVNKVGDITHNRQLNLQEDSMEVVEAATILHLKPLAITSNLLAKAMVANRVGDKDNHNNTVAKVMVVNNNQRLPRQHIVLQVMDNNNKLHQPLDIVVKATARVVAVIINNLVQVMAKVAQVAIHNNPLMEVLQVLAAMGEVLDQVDMDNEFNRYNV